MNPWRWVQDRVEARRWQRGVDEGTVGRWDGDDEEWGDNMCGTCHAVWVTEGMVPTVCSVCEPSRHA